MNIRWNFKDSDLLFEVPRDIIDVDRSNIYTGAILSNYVRWEQNETGPFKLVVTSPGGEDIYTMDGMTLFERFNYV